MSHTFAAFFDIEMYLSMGKYLLPFVMDHFKEFGIRKVTMDYLAHRLKVSKRTLYEKFSDKNKLFEVCFSNELEQYKQEILDLEIKVASPLERMIKMYVLIVKQLIPYKSRFYEDVSQYPVLLGLFNSYIDFTKDKCTEFLQEARKQGFLDETKNQEAIPDFITLYVTGLLRDKQINKKLIYFRVFFIPFIESICNDKGIENIETKRIKLNDYINYYCEYYES